MAVNRILLIIVLLAVSGLASSCGPLRLDDTPRIKGTVVAIDGDTIGIKHKTGTYYVQVTPETTIVNRIQPGTTRLCSGQRATVFLSSHRRFTASSITLWSGDCK